MDTRLIQSNIEEKTTQETLSSIQALKKIILFLLEDYCSTQAFYNHVFKNSVLQEIFTRFIEKSIEDDSFCSYLLSKEREEKESQNKKEQEEKIEYFLNLLKDKRQLLLNILLENEKKWANHHEMNKKLHAILIALTRFWPLESQLNDEENQSFICGITYETITDNNRLISANGHLYACDKKNAVSIRNAYSHSSEDFYKQPISRADKDYLFKQIDNHVPPFFHRDREEESQKENKQIRSILSGIGLTILAVILIAIFLVPIYGQLALIIGGPVAACIVPPLGYALPSLFDKVGEKLSNTWSKLKNWAAHPNQSSNTTSTSAMNTNHPAEFFLKNPSIGPTQHVEKRLSQLRAQRENEKNRAEEARKKRYSEWLTKISIKTSSGDSTIQNQSEKHFDTVNPTVTPENILKTKQITPVNFSIKQKPVREISCSDVTKGQISNRSLWLEKISEKQKPNIYPNNEFGKSDPSDLSEPPLPKCSSTSSVNR